MNAMLNEGVNHADVLFNEANKP